MPHVGGCFGICFSSSSDGSVGFSLVARCEFSGVPFTSRSEVEFTLIESLATQPLLAQDTNNVVIIMLSIHRELTNQGIHDFKGMYNF